jgi:hypothetical protein
MRWGEIAEKHAVRVLADMRHIVSDSKAVALCAT